jgi:hypothetical protein
VSESQNQADAGRLSTFTAGVFLLVLLVVLGPWVKQIPMPALVSVMIMVFIGTFSWASFKNLRVHPKSTSLVVVSTVVVVVTILACTDGSTFASSVYQHAAWAATRLTTGVELLHVMDHHREHSAKSDLTGAIGFDTTVQLTEELTRLEEAQGREARLKGKGILEDARQKLGAAGVTNFTLTQRHGTVVQTLAELEPRAELVVVAKSGDYAVLAPGQMGGHLENLIRTSVRPVLVAERNFKPIQRFLIAFDNSPSARKAVAYVVASPLLRDLNVISSWWAAPMLRMKRR